MPAPRGRPLKFRATRVLRRETICASVSRFSGLFWPEARLAFLQRALVVCLAALPGPGGGVGCTSRLNTLASWARMSSP
eukprot:16441720-Heterocapsa_arctica.AAC.1